MAVLVALGASATAGLKTADVTTAPDDASPMFEAAIADPVSAAHAAAALGTTTGVEKLGPLSPSPPPHATSSATVAQLARPRRGVKNDRPPGRRGDACMGSPACR